MSRCWLLLIGLMWGCMTARGPLIPTSMDPDVVVALARSRPMPQSLQGKFTVHIDLGDKTYTVPAALLLDQPDRFRFELYTPFGTPLATVTSDGTALHGWSQREKVFYRGDDASHVLESVTGGKIGIEDMLGIFTGMLPMADAEVLHVGRTVFDREGVAIVMLGPDDIRLRAVIDPRIGMVRRLRVDPSSENVGYQAPSTPPVLEVRYEGQTHAGKGILPKSILVDMPRLGWKIEIVVKKWKALDQAPEAFSLTPPPRSTVKDLRETLEEMAGRPVERPQP
jgi:outer membrane biogenesis lipoprotein LolB